MEAMYDPFFRPGVSRALDLAHGSIERRNRKSNTSNTSDSSNSSNGSNGSNKSPVRDSEGKERGVAAPSKVGGQPILLLCA